MQIETKELCEQLFCYKDGDLYWKITPRSDIPVGSLAGSVLDNGYIHILYKGYANKAHRLVFLLHHGYLPEMLDRIDGDRSNNRIENLRPTTSVLNGRNRNVSGNSNNKSGRIGVVFHKQSKKWDAQIGLPGKKMKFLGRFKELADAIACREAAELEYYGENNRAAA